MMGFGKVGLGLLKGKESRNAKSEGDGVDGFGGKKSEPSSPVDIQPAFKEKEDSPRSWGRVLDGKLVAKDHKGKAGLVPATFGGGGVPCRLPEKPESGQSSKHVPPPVKPQKSVVPSNRAGEGVKKAAVQSTESVLNHETRSGTPSISTVIRLNRIQARSGPLILFGGGSSGDAKEQRRTKVDDGPHHHAGCMGESQTRFSDKGIREKLDVTALNFVTQCSGSNAVANGRENLWPVDSVDKEAVATTCSESSRAGGIETPGSTVSTVPKVEHNVAKTDSRSALPASSSKGDILKSMSTQAGSAAETVGMKPLNLRQSKAGDVDSSDNESPLSQSEAPKETESPRFQALLRMTGGGKAKPLKDIKSFSHELDPKAVRLSDYWKTHSSNDLEEIMGALRSRFVSVKEEVNSELEVFAGDLVEMLDTKECSPPHLQEGIEDLLIIARKCAVMSPTDFRGQCEIIVQEVDDRRQELPIGILKQLHTRMLFILTRCTRLLQFQKEYGLDEDGPLHVLHKKSREVPSLGRAWTLNENARVLSSDRRSSFSHRRASSSYGTVDGSYESSEGSLSKGEKSLKDEGSKQDDHLDSLIANRLASWKVNAPSEPGFPSGPAPQTAPGKSQTVRIETPVPQENKRKPSEVEMRVPRPSHHQKVAWGYWGDQLNILDDNCLVICRICEDNVPSFCLEEHSRICAYADRSDHKGLSTDERLLKLAELLERLLEFHAEGSLQVSSNGGMDHAMSSHPENFQVKYDAMGAFHDRSSKNMLEAIHESPRSAEESEYSVNGQVRPKSDQGSSSSAASPLFTPATSQMDLLLADRIHLAESEDFMQINELADIARCVGKVNIAHGRALEYLESCMQDLQEVLQQNKAPALAVHTFGRRINRLLREKFLTVCDAADISSSDAASCEHDTDMHIEEDVFRWTPVHPAYKDRTTIDDFDIIKAISRGAFGRVFLAMKRTTGDLFAIKVLRKSDMIRKNAVESVQAERNILISARNPFVVRFFYSFTCKENLYLVMEYLNGGDLYSMLRNLGCLEEDMARVYIAELVLALEYLHSLGVVHRDLKPDNLLIAHDGHIKLTDFGLSRVGLINSTEDLSGPASSSKHIGDNSKADYVFAERSRQRGQHQQRSAVGTPDYLAPEILLGTGHGYTVDWWSTGIILFECLTGIPPFNAAHPQIIFDNILNRNIPWPEVPTQMSFEAQDLIDRLLTWDPNQRLGANGAAEVKSHPFFKHINWGTLARQKAAFIPSPDTPHDTGYFTSRHAWNATEAHVFPEQEIGDSSDYGSSSGSSSTTLGSGQEGIDDECRDLAEFEITPSVKYSFSNFSFKNLSQLASINYDLLLQTGRDPAVKDQRDS